MRWLLAAAVLATVSYGVTTASAQGACIDDKAAKTLTCAAGAAPRALDPSKRSGIELHAVPPPARAPSNGKPPTPSEADAGPRDDRKIRLEARQRALLA